MPPPTCRAPGGASATSPSHSSSTASRLPTTSPDTFDRVALARAADVTEAVLDELESYG